MEVLLEGVNASSDEHSAVVRPGDDVVSTLTSWWATTALEPFLRLPVDQRLDPMDVEREFLGESVAFGVRFDENLIADLLEVYAVHGWAAIEEVEGRIAKLPRRVLPTLRFVQAARNVIALMVADALVRLEATAAQFAQERWESSRRQLDTWLDEFTVLPQARGLPMFSDRKLAAKLVSQCHEYAKLRAHALELQKKISDRNTKVPAKERVKGSGADLWFELYATPQRELLTKMSDILGDINATFGAAVLVLDDLPEEILDIHDPLRERYATVALARAIYGRLSSLAAGLDTLTATLSRPSVTGILDSVVNPVRNGDVSAVAALKPPKGGYEQQVMDAVFDRDEDEDQRLFANLGLMNELREIESILPDTMEAIVLFRYVARLTDEVERRRKNDAIWDKFWSFLEWIAAALALIALMIYFPFGGAGVAPGLVSALVWAGAASLAVGVFVLALHQMVGAMQEAGELDRSARDQLFRLGQDDPAALEEIARTLAQSRALRDSVARGGFLAVLTLGASRKLKPVATALEFRGYLGDLETVFAPAVTEESDEDAVPDG